MLGLIESGYAKVTSAHGAATLRVALDDGLPRGSVFAPFHWTDMTSGLARVDALAHPVTDPISGQPESKATPVKLEPIAMASEGFLISRRRIALPAWLSHARIAVPGGEALLFASTRDAAAIHGLLSNHLGTAAVRGAALADPEHGDFRTATFEANGSTRRSSWPGARDEAALDWLIEALARTGSARRRAKRCWPDARPRAARTKAR